MILLLAHTSSRWATCISRAHPQDKAQGSRKYSQMLIHAIADSVPELMGGSADLTGSNNTDFK